MRLLSISFFPSLGFAVGLAWDFFRSVEPRFAAAFLATLFSSGMVL